MRFSQSTHLLMFLSLETLKAHWQFDFLYIKWCVEKSYQGCKIATVVSLLSLKKYRSSHQRSYVKKCVLKSQVKLHRKTPVLETFFNKVAGLQPASFLKRNSNTSAFLWSLGDFKEHRFWRTSANDCFWSCSIKNLFLKTL